MFPYCFLALCLLLGLLNGGTAPRVLVPEADPTRIARGQAVRLCAASELLSFLCGLSVFFFFWFICSWPRINPTVVCHLVKKNTEGLERVWFGVRESGAGWSQIL